MFKNEFLFSTFLLCIPIILLLSFIEVSTTSSSKKPIGPVQNDLENENLPENNTKILDEDSPPTNELLEKENGIPLCTTRFREEFNFEYFTPPLISYVRNIEDGLYLITYDRPTARIAGSQPGSDPYLVNIFNGTNMPAFIRIDCWALYPMDFGFDSFLGTALQFFRIWRRRIYLNNGKVAQSIGVEILLPPKIGGVFRICNLNNISVDYHVSAYSGAEGEITIPLKMTDDKNIGVDATQKYNRNRTLQIYKNVKSGPLELKNGGAVCTGFPFHDIEVKLLHFSATNTAAKLLVDCLADWFEPCGLSIYNKVEGFQVTRSISVISKLPSSGLLVCKINSVLYVNEYFTALDGKIYNDWREIKVELVGEKSLLRVTLQHPIWESESTDPISIPESSRGPISTKPNPPFMLIYGQGVYVNCSAAPGVFLIDRRTLFAEINYRSPVKIAEMRPWDRDYDHKYVILPRMTTSVICNDETWTYPRVFNTSVDIYLRDLDCKENEIFCGSGECVSGDKKCNRVRDCRDNSDEANCNGIFTRECNSNQFACPETGRCILQNDLCDNYDDCKDGSDEDLKLCEAKKPQFLETKSEYIFYRGGPAYLNCSIYTTLKDSEVHWQSPVSLATHPTTNRCEETYCYEILYFKNITADDAGVYICKGTNIAGNIQRNFNVIVKDCPRPEQNPVSSNNNTNQFICSSSGRYADPSDCQVFHECSDGVNGLLHYKFVCGEGTVYCQENQVCEWEWECPCV